MEVKKKIRILILEKKVRKDSIKIYTLLKVQNYVIAVERYINICSLHDKE